MSPSFDYEKKCPTTLLDGIGVNSKKSLCMAVESSGLKVIADINHLLEDSIKNVKSATDALKKIMFRFLNATIEYNSALIPCVFEERIPLNDFINQVKAFEAEQLSLTE
ncbi:hypothetical protein BDF21DRAFT_462834 [Thamnidium elegans]|nr:hypothetical protein BDF21DRAFT_462834 [Thamnidium elegans]